MPVPRGTWLENLESERRADRERGERMDINAEARGELVSDVKECTVRRESHVCARHLGARLVHGHQERTEESHGEEAQAPGFTAGH